jgi:hypothetical protein
MFGEAPEDTNCRFVPIEPVPLIVTQPANVPTLNADVLAPSK